ncbi:MAG: dinitrogenase iron-molybdenum cofactor biosynthesis protein [Oscillospiraceae bacterium]|nr:dinitrogenase iron-molybdenum cofactor biosynthesis protein [Oscillospiraceae bacterium]
MLPIHIAIATTDGKFVNEHFGRARCFYIVALDKEGHRLVERRAVPPVCDGGMHEDNALDAAAALLGDCRAVLVSRIGPPAKRRLEKSGISVFEIGLPIEDALARLRDYYDREVRETRV